MTLFTGDSLLVSLPGAEIGRIDWPGSIADPDYVLASPVSLELRSALELLRDGARRHGLPIRCLARPEMFTHGVSEMWLRDRGGVSAHHVCLSDGSTLKHLLDMPTHVFFYNLSFSDNASALERLSRRAPELISQVRSQINSYLVLGRGPNRVQPESVIIGRTIPLAHPHSTLLPFFLNRDSVEDSANRIVLAGAIAAESLRDFTALRYVPLTETAMSDRAFARFVADLIQRAFFDPSALLILRLPSDREGTAAVAHGIAAVLPGLRESGIIIPRAMRANVLLTVQDLEEDHLIIDQFPLHVLVHESFDFWRYTVDFYNRADLVTVVAGPETTLKVRFLPDDVSTVYGAKATRRWLDDPVVGD